jgi:uncharacterized protein (TIGR02001 family)
MERFMLSRPLAAIALLIGVAAQAQPVTFSETATLTSDYRFRGISQSDANPAVQGSIEASLNSGVYAGVWASTVSGTQLAGAAAEVDGYLGYRGRHAQLGYDVGVQYYTYPGSAAGSHLGYAEPYASANITVPKLSTNLKLGAAFAPKQGLAQRANLYGYGEMAQPVPTTPITLRAHLGYTRSGGQSAAPRSADTGNYLDYAVGVDYVWHRVTMNVTYLGTDISAARAAAYPFAVVDGHTNTKGRVVFSISSSF